MDLKNVISSIPKIELHAHLNGSISALTIEKLLKKSTKVNQENLLESLNNTKHMPSLDECFKIFDLIYEITDNTDVIQTITYDVIKDFFEDNVIYLELRTTPRSVSNQMTKVEYLNAVIAGVKAAKQDFPTILVKILISLNRTHAREACEENINLAIQYKDKYPDIIVGVDVSGNPNAGFWYPDLIQLARNHKLFISLHCAEVVNVNEIREMLEIKPDRIGHGTCLHPETGGNEDLWNFYCSLKIPVEICLSSNIISKTSRSYEEHHLKYVYDSNMPFTICTDDKGVFNTSLSKELEIASNILQLNKENLLDLTRNAIKYAFIETNGKNQLLDQIESWSNS